MKIRTGEDWLESVLFNEPIPNQIYPFEERIDLEELNNFQLDLEGKISLEDLLYLTKHGLETCKEKTKFCDGYCYCIRKRFKSKSIYELYKKCREFYLKHLAMMIIAKLTGVKENANEELR